MGANKNNSKPISDNTARRKCLRCHQPFKSSWSGERICKICRPAFNQDVRELSGSIDTIYTSSI